MKPNPRLTEKQKRSRAGKASRRKGQEWEQALVRMFRDAMPGAPVFRGVEVKRRRPSNPRQALRQAEADRPFGRTPVAVVKDDRARPFVAMYLDDFLRFVGEWWERRPELNQVEPINTKVNQHESK